MSDTNHTATPVETANEVVTAEVKVAQNSHRAQPLSPAGILEKIQATPRAQTVPDQWESQIFARILSRFHVVLISEADPALVTAMKMHPARNIQEALEIAEALLGRPGTVTVIPEGISTIIA